MKLRTKVLIILSSMWVVLSLLIFVDAKLTISHDYEILEKKQVIEDIDRTQNAIHNMKNALVLLNMDWAGWDDTYQFMMDKNKKFIATNLVPITYENQKLNYILLFNTQGKFVIGKQYDATKKTLSPVSPELISYLETHPSFTQHTTLKSQHAGFLKINNHYVMMSSLPIITSLATGPINGTLMMGFNWDNTPINRLAKTVKINIDFFPLPLINADKATTRAYLNLKNNEDYITPGDHEFIYGYTFIHDVNNEPIGMLRIKTPRTLYAEGLMTIEHYLIIFALIGLLVLILMWYLLKIFVLDPIIDFSKQIIKIKTNSTFHERISTHGKDEISNMVNAVNSLMEIIELTQEQLKHRLLLNTEKLERLSHLNKNLFVEVNRQKTVEQKLREDERSLRKLAYYDALTGLPNRSYFNELLKSAIEDAEKTKERMAILFLDIDKFKYINDTYGHDVGDKFLKHVGQILKSQTTEHTVARLAGDEFILFLAVNNRAMINNFVKKILQSLSTPLTTMDKEIQSTFSIGISIYPDNGTTIEELKKMADLAMYYAKNNQGNAYCYYDSIETDIV